MLFKYSFQYANGNIYFFRYNNCKPSKKNLKYIKINLLVHFNAHEIVITKINFIFQNYQLDYLYNSSDSIKSQA